MPMWKNREQGKLALRIEGGDSANSRARTGVIGAEALAAAKTSLVRVGKAEVRTRDVDDVKCEGVTY